MPSDSKPRIGVSACLLGEPVRYDGASRPHAWILGELAQRAELVPLCPETGAGLPVPRPPVQLVRLDGAIRARGVEEPERDVTDRLLAWNREAEPLLASLDALILKSRSPSCGLGSVPLFFPGGEELDRVSGLFAAFVQQAHPALTVVEESELEEEAARAAFLRRLGLR